MLESIAVYNVAASLNSSGSEVGSDMLHCV